MTTEYPHIYKKNQIFKLKTLNKNQSGRLFYFSSLKGTIPAIINHCNNLNEITARCLLGIWKLNSFFGLSKDPTDKPSASKNHSVYNTASRIFQKGGDEKEKFRKIENLKIENFLENILQEQKILEKKIDEINTKIEPEPLTTEKLANLEGILTRLDKNVKNVLGLEE